MGSSGGFGHQILPLFRNYQVFSPAQIIKWFFKRRHLQAEPSSWHCLEWSGCGRDLSRVWSLSAVAGDQGLVHVNEFHREAGRILPKMEKDRIESTNQEWEFGKLHPKTLGLDPYCKNFLNILDPKGKILWFAKMLSAFVALLAFFVLVNLTGLDFEGWFFFPD